MTVSILACTSLKKSLLISIAFDWIRHRGIVWLHRAASWIVTMFQDGSPTQGYFPVFWPITRTREIWRLVGGTVRVKKESCPRVDKLRNSNFKNVGIWVQRSPRRLFPLVHLISNWREKQTIICGWKFFTRIVLLNPIKTKQILSAIILTI